MTEPIDVDFEVLDEKPASGTTSAPRDVTARPVNGSGTSAATDPRIRDRIRDGVKNGVKTGAAKTGDFAKNVGTKAMTFAKGQLTPRKLVTRWIPGVGTTLLVADLLDAARAQVDILHHDPEPGRTQFLPVARNGHIDNPHGDDANSVDSMDKHLVEQNKELFNFDPATVYSYCDQKCPNGCPGVHAGPWEFDQEAAVIPVDNWADVLSSVYSEVSAYAGEMWADRLLEKYGHGGVAELPQLIEKTDAVSEALKAAVVASEEMAKHSFTAFREAIRAGRDEMQARVDDENSAWGWVGDMLTHRRGDDALGRLMEATQKVHEAEASNDAAVENLKAALEAWTTRAVGTEDTTTAPTITPPSTSDKPLFENPDEDPFEPVETEAPLTPGAGGIGDTADPAEPLENEDDPFFKDLEDKLGDALGGDSGNPFGSGSPFGGGSDPFGGAASPLGGGTSPFESADSPLDALSNAEDPFAKDDEDDVLDEGEGGIEEESDDDTLDEGEGGFEDEDLDDIVEKTDDAAGAPAEGEDTPAEGEEAPVTAEASVAPAAAVNTDPNSPEARTVTLPDGRQVEFPDAKTAEMVRALVAADPSAPTSIYTAADSAGFPVPPMGQPIGDMVPPSSIRPGDLVMGAAGNGVFIGNGEVLMENQEVKPLADVTQFTEPNQGVYRLDNPDAPAGTDPSTAAAQPVSADGTEAPVTGDTSPVGGGSQPDGMSTTTGTPGQPDTVPAGETVTPDADQGGGLGDTIEEESLDPNAAAF